MGAAYKEVYLYDIQCFEHHTACYIYIMFGIKVLNERISDISIKLTCQMCVLQVMPGERESAQTHRGVMRCH